MRKDVTQSMEWVTREGVQRGEDSCRTIGQGYESHADDSSMGSHDEDIDPRENIGVTLQELGTDQDKKATCCQMND